MIDGTSAASCRVLRDEPSGLLAVVVVDSWRRAGNQAPPLAAGGIRTGRYANRAEAEQDARRLARAMTLKCSLAELAIGGCKTVVMEHAGWDRTAAFLALGRQLGQFEGRLHVAGDLGTSVADLAQVAKHCSEVHLQEDDLGAALAQGVLACVLASQAHLSGQELAAASLMNKRVVVQGCGSVGSAVAMAVAGSGARMVLADLVKDRALQLAQRLELAGFGEALVVDDALAHAGDVLVACAAGGLIDEGVAAALRYRAVVAAANNLFQSRQAAEILRQRGIALVPGIVASSGAVIAGIAGRVLGQLNRQALLAAIGPRALRLLARAQAEGRSSEELAHEQALQKLASS